MGKNTTINKKRLWAAFRDYVKDGPVRPIFIKALEEIRTEEKYIKLWESFGNNFCFLNQLELPGDVWNNDPMSL